MPQRPPPAAQGGCWCRRQGFGGTAVGAGVGAVAVVLPVVAGGGDGSGLHMAVVMFAVTGLHALFGAGGGGGHLPVVPIMAQGRNLICPNAVTTGAGCSVRMLIVASTICRARFSAGGLLGNVLFWTFFCRGSCHGRSSAVHHRC